MALTGPRKLGMGRGKVYPVSRASALLNPLRRLVQSPGRTVRAMALSPAWSVLEVGSGPGFFSPYLAESSAAGHLVALDLQPGMVSLARLRLSSASSLVAGDAMALPFGRASFDAAVVATVLGEVPDRTTCLVEIHRVLKPAGLLCLAETRRDSDFIPPAKLVHLVEPLGFRSAGRRGPPWQYVARFERV
jgi:arsenite methyltransferase